ncbi:unnamed protein product [Amoebophrya sp. A120]|nr:unnamed protein product [Amoebophrya sp. A120]|eukprot:GSA120T00023546001.1
MMELPRGIRRSAWPREAGSSQSIGRKFFPSQLLVFTRSLLLLLHLQDFYTTTTLGGPGLVTAFPTYNTYQIKPNAVPNAGEAFYVEVNGQDVDVVNNRVAIMDFSDGSSSCTGASLVSDSTVDSLTNVKNSAPCSGGNSAPTRLHCGPFKIYKQAANLGFCICGATAARPSPTCLSSQDYSHGFGTRFTIAGPNPGQTFDAQVSVPTPFTIQGTALNAEDRLVAIEKTFSPSCRNFESTSATGNTMSSHVINLSGGRDAGTADTVSTWNNVQMTKVTPFILCWCGAARQTCTDTSEFRVQVGEVTVNGPQQNQVHNFVLGMSSTLMVLGTGMSPKDRVRIVNAASVNCAGAYAGSNSNSVARGADAGPTFVDGQVTPSIAQWGDVVVTSAGTYKVCWCGAKKIDTNGCTRDSEFNFEVGSITVSGPNQGGSYTPRLGLPFSVTVSGVGMHEGDRVILTDQSCGTTATNSAGVLAPPSLQADELSEMKNIWHNVILNEKKQVRLCWCARAGINCDKKEEFLAQVAIYTPLGVDNVNHFLNLDNVIKGMPFKIELKGQTATDTPIFFHHSKVRIVRKSQVTKCGDLGSSDLISAVEQTICWDYTDGCKKNGITKDGPQELEGETFATYDPVALRENGDFMICYCAGGPLGNTYQNCDKDEHYNTHVGNIKVAGIQTRTETWICSQSGGDDCKIQIISAKPSMNDRIRVIEKGGTAGCSQSERADPTAFSLGTQVSPVRIFNVTTLGGVQTGQQAIEFNFGTASRTGSYDVCYCQDYGGCNANMHFFQLAGTISIGGVNGAQAAQFCFANQPCTARIIGTLLDGGARMILLDGSQPEDSCGKPGKLVVSDHFVQRQQVNFQSPALYGFTGNKGTLGAAVDFLDFQLGEPEVVGTYMLCYCDHTLTPAKVCEYQEYYTQFAGKLYVRGIDTSLAMACEQGGECQFAVVGAIMTPADRVMAMTIDFDDAGKDVTPEDRRCGGINSAAAPDGVFSPGNVLAPQNIDLNVLTLNGKSRANYKYAQVNNPGKFRLCFCPGIPGSVSSVCESPPQFKLNLGTVRIQGVISDVKSGILPTNKVVSVKVESTQPGSRIGCVATLETMFTVARAPDLNDLMHCEDTSLNRGSNESPQTMFPLCVGRTENTDLTVTGWNDVNIEIKPDMLDIARRKLPGGNTPNWYVWCYSASQCTSQRCVMPRSPNGLKITQTGSDSPYVQDHKQTAASNIEQPITVGIKIDNPTAEIAAAARLKIIDPNEGTGFDDRVNNNLQAAALFGLTRRGLGTESAAIGSSSSSSRELTTTNTTTATLHPCETHQLASGVASGLNCGTKGDSKCEPAGTLDVTSNQITWPSIQMQSAGMYGMCYCDRHLDTKCLQWISVGEMKVDGPFPNAPTQYGNPGVLAKVHLHGLELSSRDRIHVVAGSDKCGQATVGTGSNAPSTNAPSNSSSRQLSLVWTSTAPVVHNSSYLQWEIGLQEKSRYKICWCPGKLKSCTDHSDFTHFAGYLEIATRVDCELSDFWIVEACTVPCGGGIKKKRRRIVQNPQGGGTACPSNAESLISEICNPDPCPLLQINSVTTQPSLKVVSNTVFQVRLDGQYFNPVEDRILLIDANLACGASQQHYAGAACNFVGSDMEKMICGDGVRSMKVAHSGAVKICVCDASASYVRNEDGSGFNIAGGLNVEGSFSAGCGDARNYLLGGQLVTIHAPATNPEEDDLVAGMSPGLFAFLMVLCSLVVLSPGAYFGYKKYQKQKDAGKYQKQVDPFLPFQQQKPDNFGNKKLQALMDGSTAPEKGGKSNLFTRAKSLLGIGNGDKENLSEEEENQAMLIAWDEYYQSLGYPAGTAWTVLGPQLNGTGPSMQQNISQQAALANSAYDPNDIFGGYGPSPYGQPGAPQQQQSGLLALGYDGHHAPNQMGEFLDQSFTDSRSPAAATKSKISPLSSFVDKVRRASVQMAQNKDSNGVDGASPASSQPVTPRTAANMMAGAEKPYEKPKDPGSTVSTAATQNLLPPMPKMSQPPPPVNLPVGGMMNSSSNKKKDDDMLSSGSFLSNSPNEKKSASPVAKLSSLVSGNSPASNSRAGNNNNGNASDRETQIQSPKSARLEREKQLLDEKQEMLREEMERQQQALDEEHRSREEVIKSKLSSLKEKRAQSAGRVRSLEQSLTGGASAEAMKQAAEEAERTKKEEELKKQQELELKRQKEEEAHLAAKRKEEEKQQALALKKKQEEERIKAEQAAALKKKQEEEQQKKQEQEILRKKKEQEELDLRRKKKEQEDEDRRRKALEAAAQKKKDEEIQRKKKEEEQKAAAAAATAAPSSPPPLAPPMMAPVPPPLDSTLPSSPSVAERRYGSSSQSPSRPPAPPPSIGLGPSSPSKPPLPGSINDFDQSFGTGTVAERRYGKRPPPPPPPGMAPPGGMAPLDSFGGGGASSPSKPPGGGLGMSISQGAGPSPSLFDQAMAAGMGGSSSPGGAPLTGSPIKKGKFSLGSQARTSAGGVISSPRFQNVGGERSGTGLNMLTDGGGNSNTNATSPDHSTTNARMYSSSSPPPPGAFGGGPSPPRMMSSMTGMPAPPSPTQAGTSNSMMFGGKAGPPPPPPMMGRGPGPPPSLGQTGGMGGGMRPPPPPPPPGRR